MQIVITQLQAEILGAISDLTIKRDEEVNNNKKTTINAYSISKHINREYKAVKRNLIKLKEKVCS